MGISSVSGSGTFLGGNSAGQGGANSTSTGRLSTNDGAGISFAIDEKKSSISFGASGEAGGGPAANESEKKDEGFLNFLRSFFSAEQYKRLLAMLGLDDGGGANQNSGGGGGSSGSGGGGGPSPGPRPAPSPAPNPGPGPDKTGPIAGIDQKQQHNSNSKSANLESYDPDKPKADSNKSDDEITTGFVQGQEGNCATVSGIKAAMMKFGANPKDIYKSVEKTDSGFKVVQEDGTKVELSNAELEEAKSAANFNGDDKELIKNATFMFAVSAKRAQMDGGGKN